MGEGIVLSIYWDGFLGKFRFLTYDRGEEEDPFPPCNDLSIVRNYDPFERGFSLTWMSELNEKVDRLNDGTDSFSLDDLPPGDFPAVRQEHGLPLGDYGVSGGGFDWSCAFPDSMDNDLAEEPEPSDEDLAEVLEFTGQEDVRLTYDRVWVVLYKRDDLGGTHFLSGTFDPRDGRSLDTREGDEIIVPYDFDLKIGRKALRDVERYVGGLAAKLNDCGERVHLPRRIDPYSSVVRQAS